MSTAKDLSLQALIASSAIDLPDRIGVEKLNNVHQHGVCAYAATGAVHDAIFLAFRVAHHIQGLHLTTACDRHTLQQFYRELKLSQDLQDLMMVNWWSLNFEVNKLPLDQPEA